MATAINLRHPASGLTKVGYYGFSWTTLFFGPLPALFRGDFYFFFIFLGVTIVIGAVLFVFHFFGILVLNIVWAFVYNRLYTRRLLERGYVLADIPEREEVAARKLGVSIRRTAT
jgi:hypothetical protein